MKPQPYFVSPGRAHNRRILLIGYHFAPSTAAGSLRWQKLAGLAAEVANLGVDAVALDPAALRHPDTDRYRDLPPGTRAFGVAHPVSWHDRLEAGLLRLYRVIRPVRAGAEPAGPVNDIAAVEPSSFALADIRWNLGSFLGWRRAFLTWADTARERAWARAAARTAVGVFEPGVHRMIVSCGPPHLVHEAGRLVAEATGLPLFMDMRDTWSLGQRLGEFTATPLRLIIDRYYERKAVATAALVVMNTPKAARAMSAVYPNDRVIAAANGYDDEPILPAAPTEQFVITYAGAIYLDRDPRPLITGAALAIKQLGLHPADFRVELIGTGGQYDGVRLERMATDAGIADFVSVEDAISRRALLARLARSAVLVSLYQDTTLAVPSKVYEYLRFSAHLLVLSSPDSATAELLGIASVSVVAPEDVEAIARVLVSWYQEHRQGRRPTPLASDVRFSRRWQAAALLEALKSAANPTE